MSSPPEDPQHRLRRMLDAGEYKFSRRALDEGTRDVRVACCLPGDPSAGEIVQYIVDALAPGGIILRPMPQGNPPNPDDVAWQATDRRGIFIKLKIREYEFGKFEAYIQSCHFTVHPR
jgi:hypothetical protein